MRAQICSFGRYAGETLDGAGTSPALHCRIRSASTKASGGIIPTGDQHKTQIVQVVDYDPTWPLIFEELKQAIEIQLGILAVTVEHVGSTAVPGLAAKPIIDVDIVIASETDLPRVIFLLGELGYVHLGDLGIDGREAFGRPTSDIPRLGESRQWFSHHLYVCTKESQELRRHIGFREYLRRNPSEASKYGTLKRQLALQYRYDIDGYVEGKSTFIAGALSRISI